MQNTGVIYERFCLLLYYKRYRIIFKITSAGQCAIICMTVNTATEERYTDDVCSGYEYNSETKECALGRTNTSLDASGETKTVMLKYVPPWLTPVTQSNILRFLINMIKMNRYYLLI